MRGCQKNDLICLILLYFNYFCMQGNIFNLKMRSTISRMFRLTVMLVAVRADGRECAWSGGVGCTGSPHCRRRAGGCSRQSVRSGALQGARQLSQHPALWKLQSSSRPIDGPLICFPSAAHTVTLHYASLLNKTNTCIGSTF